MTDPWTPPGQDLPQGPPPSSYPPPPHTQPPPAYRRPPAYPGGPLPDAIPPTRTMANWALGLTIFGCCGITWIVGVVLAIVVLAKAHRDPRDRGQGLAVAALVVAGAWLLVFGVKVTLGVVDAVQHPDSLGPPVPTISPGDGVADPGQQVPPAALRVGDCLDDAALVGLGTKDDESLSTTVARLPCASRHDFETYAVLPLQGDAYPGAETVATRTDAGCDRAFAAYIGKPLPVAGLSYWYYYPTPASWRAGDHDSTCVLGRLHQKTAGSLRGSQR